ncbi:MAG: hypothetical protein JKY42_03750, partial [Flavobacteriales bacterium]|nr:hypothetical protein [Flavobacteriales bacterium]
MAKKKKYTVVEPEEEIVQQKEVAQETVSTDDVLLDDSAERRARDQYFRWPMIIVFLLGLGLYIQTANYQYALDDKLVITHNYITKKGFAGIGEHFQTDFLVGFFGKQKNLLEGGRYRPMSLVSFTIENQLFGKKQQNAKGQFIVDKNGDQLYTYNPAVGHVFNAIYYAFIGLVLFLILHKLFPPNKNKLWYLSFPFIATLIYVTHPLHTEAVANIKGRDELMSLLGGLGALYFCIIYAKERGIKNLIFASISYIIALMSKEGTVTFVAIVPLTIFYFTNEKWKDIFIGTAPLAVMTVVYIAIRLQVLGGLRSADSLTPELMNMPFMYAEGSDRLATVFYTLGMYIKLLFIPHPLTHDYYPWYPLGEFMYNANVNVQTQAYPYLSWANPRAFIPLLAYLGLIGYAVRDFYRILVGKAEKNLISYAILFYMGTLFLVSNIPIQVGTFLNERFMFVPSIAYALLVAHFLLNWLPKKIQSPGTYQKTVTSLLAILLLSFSFKTVSRNQSWKNDFALSVGDVEVSGNSAKSNMSAGLALVDESKKYRKDDPTKAIQMLTKAEKHLARALNIYPRYIQPMLIMGNCYYEMANYHETIGDEPMTIKSYENAILYFEKCLKLNPRYAYSVKNLEHVGDLCTSKKYFATAAKSYETLISYDKTNIKRVYVKLGELYGKNMGDLARSKKYLVEAYKLDSESSEIL